MLHCVRNIFVHISCYYSFVSSGNFLSNSFGFVFFIVFKASGHEKRVSITCFLLYAAIKRIRMATALSVFSAIVFCCCCCPFQSLLFLRSGFYFCCSVDFKTKICRRTSLTNLPEQMKGKMHKNNGKKEPTSNGKVKLISKMRM